MKNNTVDYTKLSNSELVMNHQRPAMRRNDLAPSVAELLRGRLAAQGLIYYPSLGGWYTDPQISRGLIDGAISERDGGFYPIGESSIQEYRVGKSIKQISKSDLRKFNQWLQWVDSVNYAREIAR